MVILKTTLYNPWKFYLGQGWVLPEWENIRRGICVCNFHLLSTLGFSPLLASFRDSPQMQDDFWQGTEKDPILIVCLEISDQSNINASARWLEREQREPRVSYLGNNYTAIQ